MTFPEMYERFLVEPIFRPFAEVIVQRMELAAGDSLLDIACGTGIVARLAAKPIGPGARIVGVDINAQMIELARSLAPAMDWREGNAGALPVGDAEKFDAVVCHQGVQFFPEKQRAVQEMRRVLAPDGRVAIATWRPLEEIPFLQELHRVAERHLGPIADRRHSFAEEGALQALLAQAGFRDIEVQTVTRTIVLDEPKAFIRMNAMALVGMSAAGAGVKDAERAEIVAAIADDSSAIVPAHMDGQGLAFELGTNLAMAAG